jgi:hypothetical protein
MQFQVNPKMTEVLLEIAQNASIRGFHVNGDYLFSVLDFVKYICPGYNSIYAPTLWYRLISNNSNEVTEIMPKWQNLKFKGRGQRNTPCMTILGLQKLLLILGSKATVEFCDRVLECFNRVLAGDHTLIREIEANTAQPLSVQPMERAETGAPVQGMLNPRCDGTLTTGTKLADQETTVHIGGAPDKITKRFFFAHDMADVFGIDTSVIADFDKNAVIEKVVQGPPGVEGTWNLCTVLMAFAPTLYSARRNAVRALAQTSIADYPSRMEVQMARDNVCLPKILYHVY